MAPGSLRTLNTIQIVTVSFCDLHGLTIELIAPVGNSSPISQQARKGVKLLPLCYPVENLEAAICRAPPSVYSPLRIPYRPQRLIVAGSNG